jgi:tRNA uridine 5-carbamoylmethylation protein Kti12
MPLVIISGYPKSGKTTFANLLLNYLETRLINDNIKDKKVILINEEMLSINKSDGYKDSNNEKKTRGALKSACNTALNSDCYVIIDSLNYIKGYRYELYCIARSIRSPHCVCWIQCDNDISIKFNNDLKSLESSSLEAYDDKILLDLRLRFEEPNYKNRWDNPLFTINMTPNKDKIDEVEQSLKLLSVEDNTQQQSQSQPIKKSSWQKKDKNKIISIDNSKKDNEIINPNVSTTPPSSSTATPPSSSSSSTTTTLKTIFFSGTEKSAQDTVSGMSSNDAFEQIWDHFIGASVPLPNSSTIAAPKGDAERLYELDRISQLITQTMIQHQIDFNEGDPIIFTEYDRTITLHRHVSLNELQRHRRQYVKITGQYASNYTTNKEIGASFIDFLDVQL